MILHIDSSDLENVLLAHKDDFGSDTRWNSIGLIASGLFNIYSVVTVDFNSIIKIFLVALALVLIGRGLLSLIKVTRNPFTPNSLGDEIKAKNRIEVQSALVALIDGDCADSRRFLVYHDDSWDCDFLPNHRISDGATDEIERIALSRSLNNSLGFEIQPEAFSFVTEADSQKKSTEHDDELRYYHYRLYKVDWHDINDDWKKSPFMARNGRNCRWLTIDEMYADKRMAEINFDVLSLLKRKLQ